MRRVMCYGGLLWSLWVLQACQSKENPNNQEQVKKKLGAQEGIWRFILDLQGNEAPFLLDLQKQDNQYTAYIINGEERRESDDIQVTEDSILITIDTPGALLKARIQEDGKALEGLWVKLDYATPYEVPFRAIHGQGYRFQASKTAVEADFSGKWSVTFQEEDGKTYPAIGIFKQDGAKVTGTFLTTTGDYRFLDGQVEGKTMKLSTFDGGHGFLFNTQMQESDQIKGEFWSGKHSYETFTGYRNDTASLPDPDKLTFIKEGYDKLAFSFPNLAGDSVALSDETFQGKVVLVQIMGSWCPNCMDEAKFLAPYYEKYKKQGLEIVALAYERSPDFDKAKHRVEKMIQKMGIGYKVLIAGINDKQKAAKTLPMLNHVLAFPTTIFIDRQGKVRRIHTGFTGPGTGIYYEKFVNDFYQFMDKLLSEEA